MRRHSLVLDVGKTHVKVTVLDADGETVFSRRNGNSPLHTAQYTALDLDGIWSFFIAQIREAATQFDIGAIGIATHGAAAVLIDRETGQPVLPAMDYEYDGYGDDRYAAIRPPFGQTLSPEMPFGLNLGRQLHHQLSLLSAEQKTRTSILLYPNYWAWRLTGVLSSEITSLGCHTDLWDVPKGDYSSLVDRLGIRDMLPPIQSATQPLSWISSEVAQLTGLLENCVVYPGLHDSNAGYFPHLVTPPDARPTVISTGTWSIAMSPHTPLSLLNPSLDMLANVDAEGTPVATARYMGGREFARLCEMTNCDVATDCREKDLVQIISDRVFAFPSFDGGSGPFGQQEGNVDGRPQNGKALATMYSALMLDQLLTNLASNNDIVIEGSFASNDLLCGTLATLRPRQSVYQLRTAGGVVSGCFAAINATGATQVELGEPIAPCCLPNIESYADEWRERVVQRNISAANFRKEA